MSCRTPTGDNPFFDQSELTGEIPEDQFVKESELYEYSPNIISQYYCEPTNFCTSNDHEMLHFGQNRYQNYYDPVRYVRIPHKTDPFGDFSDPSRVYYPYFHESQKDMYNFTREDYKKPFPAHVSTYINRQRPEDVNSDCREGQGPSHLSTQGRSKSLPSSSELNKLSPLETFDNLINMRLKTFKNYEWNSSTKESNPLDQPSTKASSVHLIEQWKKEREILQKLFPESDQTKEISEEENTNEALTTSKKRKIENHY